MNRVGFVIALAICGINGLAASAAGQTTCPSGGTAPSCWVQFTISMQTVKVLELNLSSTTQVEFPTAGTRDLKARWVAATGPTATVNANTAWNLAVSSGSQNLWQPHGSARTDKPASDVQWAPSANGGADGLWTSVSTNRTTLAQGNTPVTGFTAPIYLRALVGWQADTPGQYGLTITYTLTAR